MDSTFVYESLFIRRAPRAHARLRLFCLPYAGAGASIFGAWPDLLPAEIEVVALQLPGKEDRVFEQPFAKLKPLIRTAAQAMRPYLHTIPFAIFGYCCGALIGYELAREVEKRFDLSPDHLFVASQAAPHLPYKDQSIHSLPPEKFKQNLEMLNGTSEEILQNEDMMALLLPALRADFVLYEQYTHQEGPLLACPITALGGSLDPRVKKQELEAWARHTTDEFALHLFEGEHFFVNDMPEDVLAVVATTLL